MGMLSARRRGLAAMLMVTALAAGCGDKQPGPTPEEQAAAVALRSYEALYAGRYEDFLDSRAAAGAMPPAYRQQLLQAYRQHAEQVRRAHDGVRSVSVSRAQADSSLRVMQVFLVISYGDQTAEEIVVAMTEGQHGWKLK